jgi:toxin ParE1/3/4
MRYRVTKDAERELDEIFAYWAKRASPEIASRLIDSIADRFWLLGNHPKSGRPCGDLGVGVKCFPAGKYLIYYRAGRDRSDILHIFLHIFHGTSDERQAFRLAKKSAKDKP